MKHVIWLLLLEFYIENIVEKGKKCSQGAHEEQFLGAISLLTHNILLQDFRFLC